MIVDWNIEGSGFRVQGSGNAHAPETAPPGSSSLNPEPRTLNPSSVRTLCAFAMLFLVAGCEKSIRFASFNAPLSRDRAGYLLLDLTNPDDPQAKSIANVIQHQTPDVLLLSDIDYDHADRARFLFASNYLALPEGGAPAIDYPYHFTGPVNCGVASGYDLDHDGKVITTPGTAQYAGDAIGFGFFPGQHGMMLFSKYPIDTEHVRTFTRFKWKNMPGAMLPTDASGKPWYAADVLDVLRLESADFWDIPITIDKKVVHILVNRPTLTTQDGPEHRLAKRNHDEIRFLSDYLSEDGTDHSPAKYISDDTNAHGGLVPKPHERFVILGVGDSPALDQLLKLPRVETTASPDRSEVVVSKDTKIVAGNILSPPPATQPSVGSATKQRFVYVDVKFAH